MNKSNGSIHQSQLFTKMKLLPKISILFSIIFLSSYWYIITQNDLVLYYLNDEREQHQSAFMHQPTPKRRRRRLEFVHITKTGGSAIESLASSRNITWGLCHFTNSEKLNCFNTHHVPWRELYIGTAWHAPPMVINALVPAEKNPYAGADLFTVVRNPYDRAISEYYCPYFGMGNSLYNNDPDVMNEWIQKMIMELEELPTKYYYKSPETIKFSSKKHYLNQVEYIYDSDKTTQLIENILYYEDLSNEYNDLMKEYSLKMRLPSKAKHGVNVSYNGKKKLSYKDLNEKTIESINRYAAEDFHILGYVMVKKMDDSYSLKHDKS